MTCCQNRIVRETGTFLDRIVDAKLRRLHLLRQMQPVALLRDQAEQSLQQGLLPEIACFSDAMVKKPGLAIIAEIKKTSPSRGMIQPDFHPEKQARAYAAAAADAISVLTEEDYFLGSAEHLRQVCSIVHLPVLRKDFVVEQGQIYETRLLGASAVLLICALLDDADLSLFLNLAHQLDLDALVEVHDETELNRALACGARMIGINNRDLRTFKIDLATTERLAGKVPSGKIIVSESGILEARDLERICRAGVHAVLIGEALMRVRDQDQIARIIHQFRGVGMHE
jgi:indole-3-glycerol phosphate synthase